MEEKVWNSIEELHEQALKAVDLPLKDLVEEDTVDNYYVNPKNKGWIGNSIESDWFGLANNSRREADFANLGVELKVTPIRQIKAGWSAKERLSLNIFDFNDEYKRTFENASFLEKANLIELMYYEFIKDEPSPELVIKAATLFNLHNLPEEDLLIIKQDWEIIVNKIKEGKAEELSDSLTKYLGATTKGSKSEKNMTTQPFSAKKAHRRAFTLKGSYMTSLARLIMSGEYESHDEKIIKDVNELKEKSFEDIILDRFEPFIGWSKEKLGIKFNVNIPKKNDKASSALLAKKMLNIKGEIQNTEEFKKAGIAVQIVTVKTDSSRTTEGFKINIPEENYLKPVELVTEDWESTALNDYLSSHQYLLVIYERTGEGDIFKGVKFWRMPMELLESEVKEVWLDTQKKFKEGLKLTYQEWGDSYRIQNELSKIIDKKAVYVNTSSSLASYINDSNATRVPTKNKWFNIPDDKKKSGKFSDYYCTKFAWWINPSYMYEQVQDFVH